ncbi:MAG: hypothetical protein U9O78_01590, partial [Patescibacteria group bacterium]|nr:hypothetical protein [Patescibacteria group bacterium]
MARKNKGSHIKTRVIKRIDPDATIDSIVSFLRQIVEEGLRAKKEYLVPKLTEREQPESLQYTRKLNKAYEELLTSDQFLKLLLPADVVNFFIQIKNSLSYETPPSAIELLEKLERDHQLSQSQARVLISFESERALAKSFKSTDARAAARSFLKKLSPDEKEEVAAEETEELEPKDAKPEAESPPIPSPTPTPAKDKIAGDGGAPTSPQTEEVNLEEVQRALLGPNADRTISSLTTISLNSVLLAYTSNEGLEGITYDRLDPVLQQALFNQVHAKIENFILGLSAEERAQLVNQGEFALRAKLLRQTHFFLKTDPQARILLQTALETHYQQLHQAGGDTHELAQQLEIAANTPDYIDNQLAEEAQGEDLLTEIEQTNLNNLNNSDDYRIVFAENLKIVLGLENVGEAARARNALDNSIASLILSDPLLSPRFVDNLSPSQLEFFLQTRVGEGGFFVAKDGIGQTRIKALRELIKQYWTIHRAKYFRKLSDNESEIAEANANYRHLKKDQAEEVYTKTFVATVQRKAQSIKNSSEEEDGAHKVLSKLSEEGGPARHKGTKSLYWSQLSKEKKKIYMRYVYGSSENIDNISENKAIEEFQYLKYLQALNEAITI